MPLLEGLIIKGIIAAGKYIIAKGSVAKVGVATLKTVKAIGLAKTITGIGVIGLTIGGIIWTKKRFDLLKESLNHIENKDYTKAIFKLGQLVVSSDIEVNRLPDAVHDVLIKTNCTEEYASSVASKIDDWENDIYNVVMSLS